MNAYNPSAPLPPGLVDYVVARPGEELPPIRAGFYEYVLAGNGVFVRGKREGLEVLMPWRECEVRGLSVVEPYVRLDAPRVPARALVWALQASRDVCRDGVKRELLFWLWPDGERWQMEIPAQDNTGGTVKPLYANEEGSNYARTLVDLHSHHEMRPFFSHTDDRDEQGFRLYAVLGNIFEQPSVALRVGLYGAFWNIPARWVFELPEGVRDFVGEYWGASKRELPYRRPVPFNAVFDERTGLWVPDPADSIDEVEEVDV